MVSARKTRRHLRRLSKNGVGIRSVAEILERAPWHLRNIRAGKIAKVTSQMERKVLSVPLNAHADNALVPAAKTARLVNELRTEGFTYVQLALKFEMCPKAVMRLRRKVNVRARTAMKVEKFFNRCMAESEVAA